MSESTKDGLLGSGGEQTQLLKGVLSLRDIIVTSLANIAPALGLYFTVAVLAGEVGKAAPMGVLLGGLGVLFTAYTLAHFARQFPAVGSFVTYISKGLGGRASVTFGVVIEVGYLLLQSSTVIALGLWTQDLLQTWFHVSVPWQVIAIIGGAILYALMIRGIRVTARGALILFVSEVVILLLLAIFVLAKGGANGISLSPFTFENANGARGLGLAFVLALYMFVGWEASVTFSEEARDPRRNVPIALFATLGFAVVFYVFLTWVAVIGFGPDNSAGLAGDSAPFDTLAARFGPNWLRFLIDFAGFTSIAGSLLGGVASQSRILFEMGRIGMIPRLIGRSHPKFKTPYVALLFYFAFNVVIVLVWGFLVNGVLNVYGQVATLGSIPLVLIYMGLNISAIVYTIRGQRLYANVPLGIVIAVAGVAAMIFPLWQLIQPGQAAPFNYFPWIMLAIIVISGAYAILLARRRPDLTTEIDRLIV